MNRQLASDLPEPIQYGIGIHGGEVIIGDIGFQDHTVFTALGDPVNVAARLQDMTKTLDCKAIISDEVFATAGIAAGSLAAQGSHNSRPRRADDRTHHRGSNGACEAGG